MLIITVILICCPILALLNYRYHNLYPDTESREYEDLKQREDKPKQRSNYLDWAVVGAMVVLLCSCAGELKTTTYTVERVNGRFVELKGVNNYYYFPTDTLKVNDKVKLNRVYKKSKANIY